jgi:hypothetical protein
MLLDKFYKPDNKLNLVLIGIVLSSAIFIYLFPHLYSIKIISTIIIFFLLGIFFKKFTLFSIIFAIVMCECYNNWETIDIEINKSKYYYSLEPLIKYKCLTNSISNDNKLSNIVCCDQAITNFELEEINKHFKRHEKILEHLQNLGCYSIEFSDNLIQLWYSDMVIDISKGPDNSINYDKSVLH